MELSSNRLAVIALLALSFLITVLAQTCSPTTPCTEGCCSIYGSCGFGPAFCGEGNCTSSCNATAQCGQYAPSGSENCPLNVCCSPYGFCGTTSDFCGTGCQNGCAVPTKPSCSSSGGSTSKRTIGYYESWSYTRTCDSWSPLMIEPTKWTHLNYAFALIDPSTFEIAQMNDFDTELYPIFTGLKEHNPALEIFISVGGWSAGGQIFSDMTATAANRAAFISSAITFMKTYAFDGIDIDWEYPVAPDRGGNAADFDNYVTFLKELRAACGTAYGITATLPSSYWYMQNFDIASMEPYLDWFNIMTYDIHGTWDGNNPYTKAVVQAHTNLTEIDEALDLLWRNDIDSSKVVLGLAFYGRSFTLKDSSCSTPGCPFASGGTPGKCTQTSGILSDSEIQALISQYDIVPTLDSDAGVKYMTWNDDQWVSYDDAQTFAMKVNYANKLCLGGTMVWALDLDNTVNTTSIDNLNSMDSLNFSPVVKAATVGSNAATLGIFWTPCLPPGSQQCPEGYGAISLGHGKVFDADLGHLTGEGCHGGGNGFNRVLCAPSNVRTRGCQWGPGRNGKDCNSKCPSGWLTLTKNSHIGGQKSGCKSGKYAPVCCQSVTATTNGWCYARTIDHILSGSLASRDNTLDISSSTFGSASSTKKFKRTTSLNQWNGTKALSKRQKLSGSLGCGGSYYLPLNAIPVDVPARLVSTYIGRESWSVSLSPIVEPSATMRNRKTIVVPSHVATTTYSTQVRWCDGSKYPQACYHYSSVAQYSTWQKPTCAATGVANPDRPLTKFYDSTSRVTQHNSIWSKVWITKTYVNPNGKRVSPRCQRDEWPPAHFQQGLPAGYIRLLPGSQNEGVAVSGLGGWKGFCKYPPEKQVKVEGGPIQVIGDIVYVTSITSTITTINVMDYSFFNMGAPQADPWLLTDNPCYPSTLTQDPGFALLTWDPYYGLVPTRLPYSEPPTAQYTSGKTPPSKRDLSLEETYPHFVMDGQSNKILVDEGNSTRKATDEEMLEYFGLLKCRTEDCAQELDEYDQVVQAIQNAARTPSWAAADEESITTTNPHSEAPTQAPAMGSRSNPDLIADSIASVTAQVETASSPTSTASSSQVTAYKYHAHRGLLSRRGHKSRH